MTGTGAYKQSGGKANRSGGTIAAAGPDESGVLVNKSGALVLKDVTVKTTGPTSSSDDSSFYGLDAGVLALSGSKIAEKGGSVTTTGDGANGIFAYGSGSSILISGVTIKDSGQYAHGIMAAGGGSITATDLDVSTQGGSSAAVATDRGGGTIAVKGGTFRTAGGNSPGVYSTGRVTLTGATFEASGAEAAVIEGSNSIVATNSDLTGTVNRGVMIYQSMSGDAQGQAGSYTQTGGSLSALSGPLFYVTNTTATIKLSHVKTAESPGTLLDAAAGNWGNSGSNGGSVTLTAVDQELDGNVVADKTSTVELVGPASQRRVVLRVVVDVVTVANDVGNRRPGDPRPSLPRRSPASWPSRSHLLDLSSETVTPLVVPAGLTAPVRAERSPRTSFAGGGELIPS